MWLISFLQAYIENLWKKNPSSFSYFDTFLFFLLRLCEPVYRFCFFIDQRVKRWFGGKKLHGLKVISLGNISAGGTGKSVFSHFLIKLLNNRAGAIVLRGYGGTAKKSCLISDGKRLLADVHVSGDEAFMAAKKLSVPVIVGKNRFASARILENLVTSNKCQLDYLLLDDAYQNHHLHKDFQVLLLDARHPLENGHCFPAGRLREKDCSRADAIVFTHADQVTNQKLLKYRHLVLRQVNHDYIFSGKHSFAGLLKLGGQKIDPYSLSDKRVGIVAGIGSFQGFCNSITALGIKIARFFEYSDHHWYTPLQVVSLLTLLDNGKLDVIITTRKDWSKLSGLLVGLTSSQVPFYVLDVDFKFLTQEEHIRFFALLEQKLGWLSTHGSLLK
jgi:tetraacyldisaccharide 4'-kinase